MEQGPGLHDNDFLLAGETGDDNVTAVAISVPQKRTFIDQYFTRTKKNKGTGAIEDAGEAEVLMNEDTLDECEVVLNNEPLQQDEEFATLEI